MSAIAPTFRGFRAISEVVVRMTALADWFAANRPGATVMTLRRRDLDLIQRWPAAAAVHQIHTHNGVTYWRGFELRADRTPPRYDRP